MKTINEDKEVESELEPDESKPVGTSPALADENTDSDKFRMWAAVSFAVMLLVVGVPLWWKTTEVERSPLPYNDIALLDPYKLVISTDIYIYTEYPSLYNNLRSAFLKHFKMNPSIFQIDISSIKLNSLVNKNASIDYLESEIANNKIPETQEPGSLLLVEIPSSDSYIHISKHRVIYFSKNSDLNELVDCVMSWMFDESEISLKMATMLDPQSAMANDSGVDSNTDSHATTTRLKAATSYDFVFSIVVSDPSYMNLSLDIKYLIKRYVDPLLNQLSEVGDHRARSQWIHLLNLNQWAIVGKTSDSSGVTEEATGASESATSDSKTMAVIEMESLPHIITPLEKRIGSGVCGVSGCLQLVLYVVSCQSPDLVFGNEGSLSMIAPPWGSVQILNPDKQTCNASNKYFYSPRPQPIMSTFISQIHSLLGFTNPPSDLPNVKLIRKIGSELRDWQLDSLYRMRTMQQLVSASLTLKSLAKLLGEISNIVINEEVASCVEKAVYNVEQGFHTLRSGNLIKSLRYSKQAFIHAEKAFTDPSLLALLYFPDDQKYAVYIPLFLPIMIPVFMSLKPIYKYLTSTSTK